MLREMAVVCTQIQACLNFRLQRFIFDSGNRIPQAFIKECSNSQIANLSCNVMYMHPKKKLEKHYASQGDCTQPHPER